MAARAEEQRRQRAIDQARREREARARAQHQRYRPQAQSFFGFPFYVPSADEVDEDYGNATPSPRHSWYAQPQRREPSPGRTRVPINVSCSPVCAVLCPSTLTHSCSQVQTGSNVQLRPSGTTTMPSEPAQDMEKMEVAAVTIQTAFRRHAALKRISAIRERFATLTSSFSLPSQLSFEADSYTEELGRGKLAYNKTNTAVHAFVDGCERMLQELDAVESHGALDVREARKELVKEIEQKLRNVEEEVKKAWDAQQMSVDTTEETPVIESPGVERHEEANDAQSEAQEEPKPAESSDSAATKPTSDIAVDTDQDHLAAVTSTAAAVVAASASEEPSPRADSDPSTEQASTLAPDNVAPNESSRDGEAVSNDVEMDPEVSTEVGAKAVEAGDAVRQTSTADGFVEKGDTDGDTEMGAEEGKEIEDALIVDEPALASVSAEPSERIEQAEASVEDRQPPEPELFESTGQEQPRDVTSEVDEEKDFVMV